MVHPNFTSCLMALRTSFLGWMPLATGSKVSTPCDSFVRTMKADWGHWSESPR